LDVDEVVEAKHSVARHPSTNRSDICPCGIGGTYG
jgi:hypothetical protein